MIGVWGTGLGTALPPRSSRSVTGPRDLKDITLLIVEVTGTIVPEVLLAAGKSAIPVIAVVDKLRPWALSELLLSHPTVRNLITQDDMERFDFERAMTDVREASAPGSGFAVGSAWNMPSDPKEYEDRRFLSFLAPSTAPFMGELRTALGQMRRARPTIPWEPTDTLDPPSLDKDGQLLGAGPFNLSHLVEHAREPVAQKLFAGPDDIGDWQSLPPPLLVLGDSGTGKSLLAHMIHDVLTDVPTSDGRRGRLVEVAVAGMDTRNFDYELFGATAGTWGDVAYRVGEATQAAYGTLFLDELGDMPHVAQTRLLRFFNDLQIKIQGTSQPFFPYLQIVGATNRDTDHLVALGHFRNDLLARFRTRVTLPPLRIRDRVELARLVDFVAQNPLVNPPRAADKADAEGRIVTHISDEAMRRLLDHDYRDGNFRELEFAVHNAVWRARGANRKTVDAADIELSTPRHRPDRLHRIVRVKQIPETENAVEVDGVEELLRLADRRDLVVLRSGLKYAVLADGVRYFADDE